MPHRCLHPERNEAEQLHVGVKAVQQEEHGRVDDDEHGGELEIGLKVGPLPQVAYPSRAVLDPVGRAVDEADVEEAELGAASGFGSGRSGGPRSLARTSGRRRLQQLTHPIMRSDCTRR